MVHTKRRFRITPFSWLMIVLSILFLFGLMIFIYGLLNPTVVLTYSL